jgi:EPS-associated MarR family transcriptional regulator
MSDEELHYKILKILQENPELSQREIAGVMGLSLGKVNFCMKALVEKGWVKVRNFKNSKNKIAYLYNLTPTGIEGKARLTINFLYRKMKEYDELKQEIEILQREVRS